MVGYAWGFYDGAPVPESPGVDFIIEMARNTPEDEKLNVFCLGAVTNVASAVLQAPDIISKIRLYALTMRYDFEKKAWDKSSFNARNDINGLDILLNEKELEMIVIPGNVSSKQVFLRERTREIMDNVDHPVTHVLMDRWDEVSAGDTWIMWDLALIEAFLAPDLVTIETLAAPPENEKETLKVITEIDDEAIEKRFFNKIRSLDNN
jgi:inosine-uridine nucleoside N-ribohydrolase